MKLVRTIFVALAVMLPVSWTVAKAAETTPAPAAGETEKKDKKSKTSDTAPSGGEKTDKKADKK